MELKEIIKLAREEVRTVVAMHTEGKTEEQIVAAVIARAAVQGVEQYLRDAAPPVQAPVVRLPFMLNMAPKGKRPPEVGPSDAVDVQYLDGSYRLGAFAATVSWDIVSGWRRSVRKGFMRHDLTSTAPLALQPNDWIVAITHELDTQVTTASQVKWLAVDQWRIAAESDIAQHYAHWVKHSGTDNIPLDRHEFQRVVTVVKKNGVTICTAANWIEWADVLYWKPA